MRRGGIELIVGAVRDAQWGLTLAVGLGGVWVHVADDTSLRLLPVDETDVREMLDELRGQGAARRRPRDAGCGRRPPRRDDRRFARLAERLGPRLASIEINPLRVDGATVEALDAAVVWS